MAQPTQVKGSVYYRHISHHATTLPVVTVECLGIGWGSEGLCTNQGHNRRHCVLTTRQLASGPFPSFQIQSSQAIDGPVLWLLPSHPRRPTILVLHIAPACDRALNIPELFGSLSSWEGGLWIGLVSSWVSPVCHCIIMSPPSCKHMLSWRSRRRSPTLEILGY